jgi:hypothetical protein
MAPAILVQRNCRLSDRRWVRPRYPRQESAAPPLVREREAAGVPEHVRVHLAASCQSTHRAGIACYANGQALACVYFEDATLLGW